MSSNPGGKRRLKDDILLAAVIELAVVATVIALLLSVGFSAKSLTPPLQVTARVSLVLFAATVFAAAVPRIEPLRVAFVLAFVFCHATHLVLILIRAGMTKRPQMLNDPIGILAYIAVAVIGIHALLPAPRTRPTATVRYSVFACYFIVWLTFVDFYARPWIEKGQPASPVAGGMLLLLVGAAFTYVARRA